MKLNFSERVSRLLLSTALIGLMITIVKNLGSATKNAFDGYYIDAKFPLGIEHFMVTILFTASIYLLLLLMKYCYYEYFNFVESNSELLNFNNLKKTESAYVKLLGHVRLILVTVLVSLYLFTCIFFPLTSTKIVLSVYGLMMIIIFRKSVFEFYKNLNHVYDIDFMNYLGLFSISFLFVLMFSLTLNQGGYGNIHINYRANEITNFVELSFENTEIENFTRYVYKNDENYSDKFLINKNQESFVEVLANSKYEDNITKIEKVQKKFSQSNCTYKEIYMMRRPYFLDDGNYVLLFEISLKNSLGSSKSFRIRNDFYVEDNIIYFSSEDEHTL